MPIWLSLIISLAVRFLAPWILNLFPGIPQAIKDIILELIGNLKVHQDTKQVLIEDAKSKIRGVCTNPSANCTIKE